MGRSATSTNAVKQNGHDTRFAAILLSQRQSTKILTTFPTLQQWMTNGKADIRDFMIPSMNSFRETLPSPSVSARWKKSMIRDRLFFIHWRYFIRHTSKSKLRSCSIWTRRTQPMTAACLQTQYYNHQSCDFTTTLMVYTCFLLQQTVISSF